MTILNGERIRNRKIITIFLILVIALNLINLTTYFSNPGTGTVTVSVNSAPSITAINLYDDDIGTTSNPTSTLTPNDPMTLVVEISDPDLSEGDFIASIEIRFYYDDGLGEPTSTSPDLKAIYTLTRSNSSDPGTWTVDDGLPSGSSYDPYRWILNNTYTSFSENATADTAKLIMVFTPSKIARYTPSNYWYINITVIDSFNSQSHAFQTYNITQYQEISLSPSSLSVLIQADGSSYLAGIFNVTVISNYDFKLQFKADNWTATVSLNDLKLYVDDDNDFGGSDLGNEAIYQVNTTYGPVGGWGPYTRTTWDGININYFTLNLYVFVVASTSVPPGQYTTTLYILVGL